MKIDKPLYREFKINRRGIDEDARTVELSFSSEKPYRRYFGFEILGHKASEIRLDRLKSGSAPLLSDHERTGQIGVIESVSIVGGKGRAIARFSKRPEAQHEFQDVVDGIRSNVSVGYQIHAMEKIKEDETGATYRVTDWEPLEISIVSIPADDSVGVGRANSQGASQMEINENENNVRPRTLKRQAAQDERERTLEIMAIGESHGLEREANQAIKAGHSIEQFRNFVLAKLGERQKPNYVDYSHLPDLTEITGGSRDSAMIGLTGREAGQFNFLRLIRALADPNDRQAQEAAGFERECSRAVAQRMNAAPKGAFIPWDVLTAPMPGRRDLNTSDDSSMIGTTHLASAFIDVLRNKMVIREAGARVIDGLIGNVSIPKKTAGASGYWVAEGITTNPTESEPVFGSVGLTPKTVGTYTEITRQMLLQSAPGVEQIVREDLASALSVTIDAAALHGTGADNQPTGIAATSGIGSVTGGTDGAAPDWNDIIDLESAVAIDNADIGALAYITNTKVRGKLKKTLITDTYGESHVWDRRTPGTPLNGYRAFVTNQVKSNLEKGSSGAVCSAIFFGNWTDLIIGMWGALDILVDPYTYSKSGGLLVRAIQNVDIAVRHPESFAAMLDATT